MATDLELWRAADAILDGLLDLPAEARAPALAAMALEPALDDCVRRLLAAHERPPGPLDAAPATGLAGRQVGRWTLQQEIGRGGMSVVYRATGEEAGESRSVAIKLLTLGALVAGGPERFRREQAILARLRHPHIVPLVDSGVAGDGTPWLAMPLVEGLPIDRWCEERGLDPAARIRLMLQVCDAVAHAHRNLVIHRDIKPSNVLVDVEGHVRLLDFGIGGLLQSRTGEPTRTQLAALTPQYAAPEQFERAPASTAMDVYGLGALLYRLLAGRPPRQDGPRTPADPVTLPSRACLEAPGPGDARATSRLLRGDLDAVLLKALEADPERRYASPDALAHDLRAWLGHRPVGARGAGSGYRLRCFLRRHRVGVAAGTALVLALGAGLAATLWQAERARAEAARATAVKEFLVDVLESADPEVESGRAPDTRVVLARGAERVRGEFAGEPALAAELLRLIGEVQTHLGDYEGARRQLVDALALARREKLPPEVEGGTLVLLGRLESEAGDYAAGRDWLRQALPRLAASRAPEARSAEAYALMYLGNLDSLLGEHEPALANLARAAAVEAALPPDARRRAHLKTFLGQSLANASRHEEAWEELNAALALLPAPGIADLPLLTSLGNVASALRRYEEAQRHYQVVVDMMRAAYPPDSPALATPINNLALVMGNRGQLAASEPLVREAVALRRASAGGDSARLAPVLSNYGSLLLNLDRADEAAPILAEAHAAAAASLGPAHARTLLVRSFECQAMAMRGDRAGLVACERDLLAGFGADRAAWPVTTTGPLRRVGASWLMLGEPAAALPLFEAALAVDEQLAIEPGTPAHRQGQAYRLLALALLGRAEPEASAALAAAAPALPAEATLERADVCIALAAQALARGDATAAEAHLGDMHALFEGADLPARLPRLVARLREMPAPPR